MRGGLLRLVSRAFAAVVPADVEENPVFVTSAAAVMNTLQVITRLPAMN